MRPDDALVRHYLNHSMVMRLATVSARGNASLTPLWFVQDRHRLIASTGAATLAARNIGADPRVALLLDGEKAGRSDMVLRIIGVAEVHEGLPRARMFARIAAKYYLAPLGLRSEVANAGRWRLRTRYYGQSDAVWLAIEPSRAELVTVPFAD